MTPIPKPVVRAVLKRDVICVIASLSCVGVPTVADHRANRGHGGSKVLNDVRNLIAACGLCNGGKEDADEDYRADLITRGVRVIQDSTNAKTVVRAATTPVTFPDGTVWLLLADGTREEAMRQKEGGG